MTMYVRVNTDNQIVETINVEGSLTDAQMADLGVLLFVTVDPPYDPATQKLVGRQNVISGTILQSIAVYTEKTKEDLFQDALATRERLMHVEQMVETLAPLVKRMADWVALQVDPNNPSTAFTFTVDESSALSSIVDVLVQHKLPARA